MADEVPTSHGRGRGRGASRINENADGSSSTSDNRTVKQNDNGIGGAPTGHKRGTTREMRTYTIHSTKPDSAQNSKEGTTGETVHLKTNYFRLIQRPTFEFNQYRVDFEPDIEIAGMRKAFVRQQTESLGGHLFDGQSTIYTTKKLSQELTVFECVSREGIKHTMTVKATGNQILMTDGMAVQVLNIILRRAMDGLNMQLVGRNMYDPKAKVELREFKVDLWPGYITSIRQHEHNVLVCCEVSHKVMRQDTIYDILRRIQNDHGDGWKIEFEKEIIGSTVLTPYNNQTYQISDVDYVGNPMSTFDQKGTPVSFADYYSNRYKVKINDCKQPLLISNPKARDIRDGRDKPIVLIPELCRATGLTDKMRANFNMMKAMAEHTQMAPQSRIQRLLNFSKRLGDSDDSRRQLLSFGTKVDTELVKLTGRKLPQEEMIFGNDVVVRNNDRVDWTNSLKTNQMYQCVPLKRWVVLAPKRCQREVEDFIPILMEVAQGMHYEVGNPKFQFIDNDRTQTYVAALEGILAKDPKLVYVVVPNNAADRYSSIKKMTCVDRAVPTQVIMSKTMMPKKTGRAGLQSIATKVVIQINCKLGGAPWMIKFPMKGVMTVGFDVTHDTRDKSVSYGAFVASMDLKAIVRYYSAVTPHKNGQEMSENIETHMVQALRAYKELHDALPDRIFFYRDGVGDGQIEYIHTQEVKNINKKLEDIYNRFGGGTKPKMAFLIVTKRLNTRFFLSRGSNNENPLPGTIVDTVVTLPERYDFYLISQCVRQGTVGPTSYNVIHDTSGLTPDKMQQVAYKMCHLYYNWSGTLRVPAVVQYAHKLAFLTGEFLHGSPNPELRDKLFYL